MFLDIVILYLNKLKDYKCREVVVTAVENKTSNTYSNLVTFLTVLIHHNLGRLFT